MSEQIVKADTRYRRKLFLGYGIGILLIAGLVFFILPLFLEYLRNCAIQEFLRVTEICVIVFLLSFIGPAVFLMRVGGKIIRHGQVPYPGMKVIHDTKVISGKKAIFRGKILVFLAILSIVVAITGVIASHHFFEKFRHFKFNASPTRLACEKSVSPYAMVTKIEPCSCNKKST